jgi:Tfp pilus assembly protein PilN
MVQLRLEERAQAKHQAGRAAGACVFETVIAISIVVVLGLSSAFAHQLSEQAHGIIARIADQNNRRVANLESNPRKLDETEVHERVLDVIRQLHTEQTRHATLSNDAGMKSREIWLKSVTNQGQSIVIDGMAITPDAVGEIISDLRSTGYFSNIEIKETYQDDSQNKAHAFTFQLTCEVDIDRS